MHIVKLDINDMLNAIAELARSIGFWLSLGLGRNGEQTQGQSQNGSDSSQAPGKIAALSCFRCHKSSVKVSPENHNEKVTPGVFEKKVDAPSGWPTR